MLVTGVSVGSQASARLDPQRQDIQRCWNRQRTAVNTASATLRPCSATISNARASSQYISGLRLAAAPCRNSARPPDLRLHLEPHDADPIGRDQQVVGAEHRAVAGEVDQGGQPLPCTLDYADHLQRAVYNASPGSARSPSGRPACFSRRLMAIPPNRRYIPIGRGQLQPLLPGRLRQCSPTSVSRYKGPVLAWRPVPGICDRAGVGVGAAQQHFGRGQASAHLVDHEFVDGQHVERHQRQADSPVRRNRAVAVRSSWTPVLPLVRSP